MGMSLIELSPHKPPAKTWTWLTQCRRAYPDTFIEVSEICSVWVPY